MIPILVGLKCAICSEDFVTELTVVRKCVRKMFGFYVVPNHINTIFLIVAQWTDIWARVQSLNKLFKILGFYDRTYKRKVSFYFTFYIISNNRIQSFIYETKGSDLWYLILCFAYAPFVPNTLSQYSQLYVNVLGKCCDSTWFLISFNFNIVLEHKVQQKIPFCPLLANCSKSAGLVISP